MTEASSISTPANPTSHLTSRGDPFHDPKLFRKIVGSLQYVIITRPDIAYAVNRVCQFMHSPTSLHWQATKRIIRYLKGTSHHYLHFTPTRAQSLLAYSDVGWLSDTEDSKSQYGYAIFMDPILSAGLLENNELLQDLAPKLSIVHSHTLLLSCCGSNNCFKIFVFLLYVLHYCYVIMSAPFF